VLAQAAGFAVLAAVSPTSLLVMAIFLGSANPRRTALMYVSGAAIMTVTMAVVILFVLRATGLNQPRQHDPRYGLRLGLGLIALAVGVYMSSPASSPGSPRARARVPPSSPACCCSPRRRRSSPPSRSSPRRTRAFPSLPRRCLSSSLSPWRSSGFRWSPTSPSPRRRRASCGPPTTGSGCTAGCWPSAPCGSRARCLSSTAPSASRTDRQALTATVPTAQRQAVIYVTPACRKTCHAGPIYGTLML